MPGISRFCNKWKYLFLALFTFVIYFSTFSHNFIPDDWYYLGIYQKFDFIQEFFIAFFGGAFSFPVVANGFYRPIQSIFYHFGYYFFGLNPTGYKIIVFVLFISCSVLVFKLSDFFFKDHCISFLASIIYISRGVNDFTLFTSNSIGNVSSDFFMLSSLYCYLIFKRDGITQFFIISIFAYCGAFFSKEASVILLFLILLIEVFHSHSHKTNFKYSFNVIVPFFLIFCLYISRIFFIRSRMIDTGPYSMSFTIPILLNNFLFLVQVIFNNYFEVLLFLICCVLVLLSKVNIREFFNKNFLFIGICLIGLWPYLFLKAHVFSYYSGFSSIGFSAIFAYLILTSIKNDLHKKYLMSILVLLFILSGFFTFQVYQDINHPSSPYTFHEKRINNILNYLNQTNKSYDNTTIVFINSSEDLAYGLAYGNAIKMNYKNVSRVYFDFETLPKFDNNSKIYYFNYVHVNQNISLISFNEG